MRKVAVLHMQHGDSVSSDAKATCVDCAFCEQGHFERYVLKETTNFRIITDRAPLVEGHLLIIPKDHYACYGAVPASLDEELFALKHEVLQFFERFYASPVYWEHGVFRQTVFHAHLHCFPFGDVTYNIETDLHEIIAMSQGDIRTWYRKHGHYFFLENSRYATLFAPRMESYLVVIQDVLWKSASKHMKHTEWHTAQQRYEEGKPLIQATTEKWQTFQQGRTSATN